MCRHLQTLGVVVLALCGVAGMASKAAADQYIITLDPEARSEVATGRVILFFTPDTPEWQDIRPIDGPFFHSPQPIASVAVTDFKPGASIAIEGSVEGFPGPLDALNGPMRVQAILDADQTERSHTEGPGNVYSDVVKVNLSPARDQRVVLRLTNRIEGPPQREERENLKWVRFRSEVLSEFYGRDVYHRAGVALPRGYNDPEWPRQEWPAIYVVPGFGGRDEEAEDYATLLESRGVEQVAPIGVYIVLDPEAPLGHHMFCDSANNGPRATAFVQEFIPHLEKEFRIAPRPEARLITGHSSGGWAALWLQLNHPEVFGGCWASAPDPVDFRAFQLTNIYTDRNLFFDEMGQPVPSYRDFADGPEPQVLMTVRQEIRMEHAIDPEGRSGQQWAAWNAAFSPRDQKTGMPISMFDPISGDINNLVLRHWTRYDISHVTGARWHRWWPTLRDKVRLACGELDSYYLERAVIMFRDRLKEIAAEHELETKGDGYILLVPHATHDTVLRRVFIRWNDEMRAHLKSHGLQDER